MDLQQLIEDLTDLKNVKLDDKKIKDLKVHCRRSEENIGRAFHIIWTQLTIHNSQTRLLSLQIMDILFDRSSAFRDLLLPNFQEFAELSLGINPKCSLPPPKVAANKLIHNATCIIKKWHHKYGTAYKCLDLAFKFLKDCKGIKFDDPTFDEHAKQLSDKEKMEMEKTVSLNVAAEQLKELKEEMMTCITEIKSCFDILVPKPSEFQVFSLDKNDDAEKNIDDDDGDDDFYEVVSGDENECSRSFPSRLHGISMQRIHLTFNFDENNLISVKKSEDNIDVLTSMNEMVYLLSERYLPALKSTLDTFRKHESTSKDFDDAIKLKTDAEITLEKASQINVHESDEESDYGDFVDVPQLDEGENFSPHHSGNLSFPGMSRPIFSSRKKTSKQRLNKNSDRNKRILKKLIRSKLKH